jgi:putative ABC transport system ATP-binding protein
MHTPHLPLLCIEDLHHSFELSDQEHLELFHGISLKLYEGESVAITGASGEGKSTLLHILGGLESPTQGFQLWKGEKKLPKREEIGFIFQNFHLLEDLSVLENILLPIRVQKRKLTPKDFDAGLTLLKQVGLNERHKQLCAQLSGGEKQRCAIARAAITQPKLILADEPTGNLDHQTALQVSQLLFDMIKQLGSTLLLVTHDKNLASCCQRVLHLENGVLEEV